MADKKITDMSAAATLTGAELMEVVQSGVNVKAALTALSALYATDAELTAAVAAEATLARNGDNITSGTVADARIAATIARDSEVTTAVSNHEADTTAVHGITDTSTLYRTGGTDVAVADGGTGASDAVAARAALETAAAGPGYVTGDRHSYPWITTSTRTVAQGNLFVVPYMARSTFTADRIGVEISTVGTASSVVRLGIWNHNPATGKPGTLLLDCGTVSGLALAEVLATISQSIPQGWVWLGCVGQTVTGSMAVRGFTNGIGPSPLQAQGVISSGIVPATCLLITGITGALATLVGATFSATSASGPQIQLRVA